MEWFTSEFVSNAIAQLFPDNSLSSFTNFLPEQLNLERQWEVAISEKILPITVPTQNLSQNVTEGKFSFFDKKFSISSELYYLEPSVYRAITDVVEAMNTLIQQKHNHNENCVTVEMSRRTQKFEIYLANERSGLAFFSRDLEHIFGSIVGNGLGAMLRGKEARKLEFAYDFVRTHSLMVHKELIEHNIIGDTKAPLLRGISLILKLKAADNITTGQYMNYQTFSNVQFKPLLKTFFHSFHIDLRHTSGEKKIIWFCRYHSSCLDV